jgi:uncharacterized protein YkwD
MKRFAVAIAVFFIAGAFAQGDAALDETRVTLRAHVVKLINRDRAIYGLPPVELDPKLSALADEYCRTQIRNGTTGHFTTDGLAPYMRYSFAGVDDGLSENAAAWSANYRFTDRALFEMARRSEDAMMAEVAPHDGHKRTILDPHATHVGIGLAWERGEFRLVHEFVRRYVDWTRPVPRAAKLGDHVVVRGVPSTGRVAAITVHHEPLPQTMPAHVANSIASYALPDKRSDYLPRIRQRGRLYTDGSRGDIHVSDEGAFSFAVPFTDGPGVYTVVVWIRKEGVAKPIAASNVSIRVTAPDHIGTR